MSKVAIIGGGIAGPVLAMALQKAGFEAEIFEQYERTAEGVGSFMNIAPNGVDAVEGLGLGDLIRSVGTHTPAMAFYSRNGEKLTDDIPFDRDGGKGNTTLTRSALYVALRDEAVQRGIPINYGKKFVDAIPGRDGVAIDFADGTSTSASLLVGADGLYSRVRQTIDPLASSPRYLGVLNAWGYVPSYPISEAPGVIRMYFNRKCFFMFTHLESGELYWYANPAREQRPFVDELQGGETWRSQMLALVRDEDSPAKDIIDATPTMEAPFTNCDLPGVTRWSRGPMVLLGDAAHAASPTSGSGASIAMEDAVILAKCLRDHQETAEALRLYESIRRPRVESIVAQGHRHVRGNLAGPARAHARDFFIKRKFAKSPKPLWTHHHHLDWDSPVTEA